MPFDKSTVPAWVGPVIDMYEVFETRPEVELSDIYDDNVKFTDPIHTVVGLTELVRYFNKTAKNLHYCRFQFVDVFADESRAWLKWEMTFSHAKLSGGKEITMPGATELIREAKVVQHIDYYDVGAMLYEHLPILGFVTRLLKRNLGN